MVLVQAKKVYSLSNNLICRIKQNSFQFLFEKLDVGYQSNVKGQAVPHTLGAGGAGRSTLLVQRWRTLALMRPVLNAEQPDHAFQLSGERHHNIPGKSWDVIYGSNQLGQIRRCTTIDCMVYQKAEFELDYLCNL